MADCKTIPELYFFDVLAQTNAIIHLFEKQAIINLNLTDIHNKM